MLYLNPYRRSFVSNIDERKTLKSWQLLKHILFDHCSWTWKITPTREKTVLECETDTSPAINIGVEAYCTKCGRSFWKHKERIDAQGSLPFFISMSTIRNDESFIISLVYMINNYDASIRKAAGMKQLLPVALSPHITHYC
jgi:hypothetical protein